jgi:hypothetical protein
MQGAPAPFTMNYTKKIIRINADADSSLMGVALGRLCIYFNIPVNQISKDLDVSKAAIYRWFTGKHEVGKHLRPKVDAYYRSILSRP